MTASRPGATRIDAGTTLSRRQAAASALEDAALEGHDCIAPRPELEVFGGLSAALEYLHRRWVTRLGVAVDLEMEEAGSEPIQAVWRGWQRSLAEHPGLAAILVRHRGDSAVASADRHHRHLMASALRCRPDQLPCFALPDQTPAGSEDGLRYGLVNLIA